MLGKELTIINKLGLHARAATKLVQIAQEYENADITLSANDIDADAKSIMEVLMLAATKGTSIKLRVENDKNSEAEIIQRLEELTLNRFDETE